MVRILVTYPADPGAPRWTTGLERSTSPFAFDPQTGLPARIGTRDADNVDGDSTYDLVLSDWRDVSGVKIAHRQSYQLNGREVVRIQYEEARLDAPVPAAQLELPAELRAAAPGRQRARCLPVGHPAAVHRHVSRLGRGEFRFRRCRWPAAFRARARRLAGGRRNAQCARGGDGRSP